MEWTKTQSDQITELYGRLKKENQAEANDKLFSGPQLPYEAARGTLVDILNRQESGHGIEAKVGGQNKSHSSAKPVPLGPLGYAAAATILISIMTGLPPFFY
ncbi:MAG TPA: hypothetical protein VI564_01350 [Candidatus Nanoarchaeia archaeon]|nr:hypothetical protein [Candidatus Nanoarchaeia archaeon]